SHRKDGSGGTAACLSAPHRPEPAGGRAPTDAGRPERGGERQEALAPSDRREPIHSRAAPEPDRSRASRGRARPDEGHLAAGNHPHAGRLGTMGSTSKRLRVPSTPPVAAVDE